MTFPWLTKDDREDGPDIPGPVAMPVVPTAEWLAEQARKQAAYAANRAAWHQAPERRYERADVWTFVPCRCKKCGRALPGGAQLRLPF